MSSGCRRFEGRVVLITGAAQGFGLASALRLGQEGAHLALLDLQKEKIAEAARQVGRDTGASTLGIAANVADAEAVSQAISDTIARFGRLDVLVNSAGILRLSDVLTCTEEEWDLVLAVHLKGTFLTCKTALPHMVEQKSGRIVNISSSAGKMGGILSGIAYNTAKGGILSFTKSLARQFAPSGITANAICPGTADTPMGHQFSDEQLSTLVSRIPMGRLASPADVAAAVAYLASDDGGFVTGEMLDVSGGMVMD